MSTELVPGAYGIPEPVASATKFPDNVPDREALMIITGDLHLMQIVTG